MDSTHSRIRALQLERARLLLERSRDPLTDHQKEALQNLTRTLCDRAGRITKAANSQPPTRLLQ